jgi:hypothetical protein
MGKPFGSSGERGSSPDGLAMMMAVGGGELSVVIQIRGRGKRRRGRRGT